MLFAPLTGLEVKGIVRKGDVLHISTRINTNLKVQTIEEMWAKMKSSHLGMVDILTEDLQTMGIADDRLAPLARHRADADSRDDEGKYNSAEFYLEQTKNALARKQDVCRDVLLAEDARTTLFENAAAQISGSDHFAHTLQALAGDEAKAERFVQHVAITEVAMRHIPSEQITASLLRQVAGALTHRPPGTVTLDLTGEVMSDAIKTLVGEALLGLKRCASIAMILTDQYNLSNTVDELQLADSRLQTSGSG